MKFICESILDNYASSDNQDGAKKICKEINDLFNEQFPDEFAKSSRDLIIESSTTVLEIRLYVTTQAESEILKLLIVQAGRMYMNILDNSTYVSERSKVFLQANFELDGFDTAGYVGCRDDVLSLSCSFSFSDYAKPIDAAKLMITLLRNFIMFEDAHSNELCKMDVVLRIRMKNNNILSLADTIGEEEFEGQIDNGLKYEDEYAFDFMSFLMHYVSKFFPKFKQFNALEWERLYVAGKYDVPFYQQLHNYLKRENKRWKR